MGSMSSPTLLQRLIAHNAWADDRAIAALRIAQQNGFLLPKVLELQCHIVGAEETWLARIEERAPGTSVWPSLTLDECEALAGRVHQSLLHLVDALDAGQQRRLVHYRNSAGAEFDSTIEDMLLQVATHGSYHRGQIALLLREAGAEPSPTDYIAFVRGAPAATRQGA
jgi:uncharacterized damage-inducible protein DinB